jgi:hypothetical protein
LTEANNVLSNHKLDKPNISKKVHEEQSELDQDETTEQMSPEAIPTEGITITRSGRESKQPIRLNLQQSALTNNKEAKRVYN